MKERSEICSEEHLEFLDGLRESGETNMWGAVPYIEEEFSDLTEKQAKEILLYWIKTFNERSAR